ncbi:MAG: phosphoribosylglycinamide formyltransferase [Candidatus Cloacimonetes bacterium]|nr:phosphoribosylglycinamide formyltransferase [Candidatus Cloacimonadota bacterium]
MSATFNIAFLTSGKSRGSNFESIIKYIRKSQVPIKVKFLVITRSDAPIVHRADMFGIPYILLDENASFENELLIHINNEDIHLIVLAGFMRKLSENFLTNFSGDIINIHPALLPNYGGKGMYGMKVHEAVFAANEKYSGASVHYVNERYDEGEIIDQRRIPIEHCKTPDEIAHEVLKIEHELYPEVIERLAADFLANHK